MGLCLVSDLCLESDLCWESDGLDPALRLGAAPTWLSGVLG